MKVLFIAKGDLPDYQSDMVFHGLRSLLGENCVDSTEQWYMYNELKQKYWNQRAPENGKSYGRGFTICAHLPQIKIDRTDIQRKILDRYFDKIVYGSIHRCQDFLRDVLKTYEKKDIIFIDGEDQSDFIVESLLERGMYFKRELIYDNVNLHPINFCVPSHLIVDDIPTKTKDYGTVIPGNLETYIFDTEDAYYKDYQTSFYGVTYKKGGWDCLRHYEIMMNGCMPYFPGLENCPPQTMASFPKHIVLQSNQLLEKNGLPDNYTEMVDELLEFTRTNLTTAKIAQQILNT